jgi:hypothetical protein
MSYLKAGAMCHHGPLVFAGWAVEQTAHERDFDKDAKGSSYAWRLYQVLGGPRVSAAAVTDEFRAAQLGSEQYNSGMALAALFRNAAWFRRR